MEPIHSTWSGSSSHTQTGRGVPQKRSRDRAQSTLPFSHSPIRPSPTSDGSQLISALCFSISSLSVDVAANQESRAM